MRLCVNEGDDDDDDDEPNVGSDGDVAVEGEDFVTTEFIFDDEGVLRLMGNGGEEVNNDGACLGRVDGVANAFLLTVAGLLEIT